MKIKRIFASLLCLMIISSVMNISVFAKPEPGVYTAHVTTSYYNPDTGNVDDGGTANAALGEGMCRSATDEAGFVEVDKNGDIWLTIRLLLQSNCKNIAFYTRTAYDKYEKVDYEITSEDSEKDSIDYRFKVTDEGVKLKGTMYVTPMGRDVLWYLYVDKDSLKPGNGDFVVSIDTKNLKKDKKENKTEKKTEKNDSSKSVQKHSAEKSAPAAEPVAAETKTEDTTPVPEKSPEASDDPKASESPVPQESAETLKPTESPEVTATAEPAETEKAEETEEPEEEQKAEGNNNTASIVVGVIIAVLLIGAGIAIYLKKRKK